MTTRFLSKFCIPLQLHERLFLCSFLAQTIYTLLNSSPLKWKPLRISSAQIKFCQIPYANFETTSWFLSKFCIPLHFHERLLLCTFLARTIYTLIIRSPLKWKSLRLSSAWVKIHQILKWRVNFPSNFASFFILMTRNPSVNFKLILFLLWIKGSHHPNFETLNYSGENLPYSSCHFPNQKLVFLQILRHPSVSWKITSMYFFRSNIKYFAHFSL